MKEETDELKMCRCRACGVRFFGAVVERREADGAVARFACCPRCGFVRVSPMAKRDAVVEL